MLFFLRFSSFDLAVDTLLAPPVLDTLATALCELWLGNMERGEVEIMNSSGMRSGLLGRDRDLRTARLKGEVERRAAVVSGTPSLTGGGGAAGPGAAGTRLRAPPACIYLSECGHQVY